MGGDELKPKKNIAKEIVGLEKWKEKQKRFI